MELAAQVNTKELKPGATHAPELAGMHYVFTVIPANESKYLDFDKQVPRDHVTARFLFRAEGDHWGQKAMVYRQQLRPLSQLSSDEDALKVLAANALPEGDEAMTKLAKDAHNWAIDMAMKTFEAWHSTETP